jgi:hypothetical protein
MNTFLDTHVLITLRTTQTRTGFYISVRVVDRDYLGAPGRQMAFFSTAKSRHLTPKIGCAVFPELRRAEFVSSEMPVCAPFKGEQPLPLSFPDHHEERKCMEILPDEEMSRESA